MSEPVVTPRLIGEWPAVVASLIEEDVYSKTRKYLGNMYGHGSRWGQNPRNTALARAGGNVLD